jgi:hypothetical protein
VTLGDLVRCGKLTPGLAALTSLYKGETYTADLGPSGKTYDIKTSCNPAVSP